MKNRKRYQKWIRHVREAAEKEWRANDKPTSSAVEVTISNYYTEAPPDVDNIIKPILDALRGIVKKWGNEFRWCILLLRANKSWARHPARRRHHHERAYRERIQPVNPGLGRLGGVVPAAGPGRAARTAGGGGDRVPRAGEIAAPRPGRDRGNGPRRLPEWAWPAAPVEHGAGHAHRASPAGARPGRAVRKPGPAPVCPPHRRRGRTAAAALPARAGGRRFRPGAARPLGGGRAALPQHDAAPQEPLAGGVRGLEPTLAGRGSSGLPLGRWDLRQSRAGERESLPPGGGGRAGGRAEGAAGSAERLPRVHRELGGAAAGSEAAGDELPAAGDRRWEPRVVGRRGPGLSGGRRAALLEPPDPQCAGPSAREGAGASIGVAAADDVRRDAGKGGRVEGEVCRLVRKAPVRGGRPAVGRGLGAAGRLLRLSAGPLGASAHDQPGGVAVRGGTAADECGETVQAGGERDGDAVEAAAGR